MRKFGMPARLVLGRLGLGLALGAALTLAATRSPVLAQDALNADQVEAVETLIHDYIMDHPEIILDAVKAMREREEAAVKASAKQALVARRGELISDAAAPVAGNPDGDVTLIEFFDYRCGYCKAALTVVRQIMREDPDLRLVFKEFPILSKESRIAARAALAAERQGRYFEFHNALMGARGSYSMDHIVEVAEEIGLDIDRLLEDMKDPAIDAAIGANADLARALGITGTPTFIVGDQLHPGGLDIKTLRGLIERQRTG